MSELVKCEVCEARAPRPRMHAAPHGWLYLEAKDSESGETTILFACSREHANAQWLDGPGPRWTSAELDAAESLEAIDDAERRVVDVACVLKDLRVADSKRSSFEIIGGPSVRTACALMDLEAAVDALRQLSPAR